MLLGFAEKNPGMTRVLIGDALVNEDARLQARMNQLHDKLEATLKQCLRVAATEAPEGAPTGADAAGPHANALLCYVVGRWHQFAKSGFKRKPAEGFDRQWPLLGLGGPRACHRTRALHSIAGATPWEAGTSIGALTGRQRREQTAQAGSRFNRIDRHSIVSASSISSRPTSGSPTPASSFSASAACIAPMMPTSGANTPMVAQRTSSSRRSSGNRQA